jgi:hypothetical protein
MKIKCICKGKNLLLEGHAWYTASEVYFVQSAYWNLGDSPLCNFNDENILH